MPTECNAEQLDFGIVEGRAVEAAFDGGAVTSDAGALLLSAADRAIDLMRRVAACFSDRRRAELIEHEVVTLVGQRVFAIALGYEDLNDHDELRHDPVMAVLAGKLEARRADCAPAAGKSTLNRLELSQPSPSRYHKISYRAAELERLLVDVFVEAHERAPRQIIPGGGIWAPGGVTTDGKSLFVAPATRLGRALGWAAKPSFACRPI
jgi:DDE family transposase